NDPEDPRVWWNGVVYFEFPLDSSSPSRVDNVAPSVGGWGLRLSNGSTIPNPVYSHEKGTSIATNQPLYVKGHYNADGAQTSDGATEPDDDANFAHMNEEAPAALIADAITLLSDNWDDVKSNKGLSSRIPASHLEISAALLTGLVPSGKENGNSYSGGVENFPRFLEEWGGDVTIRGSIVSLFESEVADQKWDEDAYSAPSRDWGFHSKFAEGYYPPGTPNTRTYRRLNYREIDAEEYAAALELIDNEF
ncbi:MAG: hypothetical protein ACOCVG_04575, partial [Verrucomicrobiota bacterium]